ncbi:MAG: cytochrome c3 family protein [Anaerolineae bacterium]|nr:cytochrome c3 family protein [Anaerolineae bacterium]
MPGPPPNCVTCKFPTDDEIRIAPTMDFVAEEDWVGIGCATCHQVEGDTVYAAGNAWLNPLSNEYMTVATPNELCAMCHVDSTGVSATGGRGVDHKIVLGGSAHKNWAATMGERRPEYCTDCHDPHTQEPQGCVECHNDVPELDTHIKGFNDAHLDVVSCIACHDASGAAVGPHPDEAMEGIWTTVEYGMSRSGDPTVTAIVSHSQQWLVACDRCHYADNEWDLSVLTAAGEVPEPEEAE